MLTATRGKKSQCHIDVLIPDDHSAIIKQYTDTPDGEEKTALWATLSPEQQAAILKEFEG